MRLRLAASILDGTGAMHAHPGVFLVSLLPAITSPHSEVVATCSEV